MASPSHRKLSRKELKSDEFADLFASVGDFIGDNLARVIIGSVAVIVVIVLFFAVSFYHQHRLLMVSEQFYQAVNALNEKDYKSAERGFAALADRSPHSRLGHLARFYLANTYLVQNQPTAARDALQAYLKDGNGELLFRQMALAQLGITDEELGQYANAHAAYREGAQLPGPERAKAEIGAARTLGLQGNRAGAIRDYQRFLQQNPFALERTQVVEALAQLGAAPAGSEGQRIEVTDSPSPPAATSKRTTNGPGAKASPAVTPESAPGR